MFYTCKFIWIFVAQTGTDRQVDRQTKKTDRYTQTHRHKVKTTGGRTDRQTQADRYWQLVLFNSYFLWYRDFYMITFFICTLILHLMYIFHISIQNLCDDIDSYFLARDLVRSNWIMKMGIFLSNLIKFFIFHLIVYDTLPPLIDIGVHVTPKIMLVTAM